MVRRFLWRIKAFVVGCIPNRVMRKIKMKSMMKKVIGLFAVSLLALGLAAPASADSSTVSVLMTGAGDVFAGQGGAVSQFNAAAGSVSPFAATQSQVGGSMQLGGDGLVAQFAGGVMTTAAAETLPWVTSTSSSSQAGASAGSIGGTVTVNVGGGSSAIAVGNWPVQ